MPGDRTQIAGLLPTTTLPRLSGHIYTHPTDDRRVVDRRVVGPAVVARARPGYGHRRAVPRLQLRDREVEVVVIELQAALVLAILVLRYGDVFLQVVAVAVQVRHRTPVVHLADDEYLRDEFHGPESQRTAQRDHVDLIGAQPADDVKYVVE